MLAFANLIDKNACVVTSKGVFMTVEAFPFNTKSKHAQGLETLAEAADRLNQILREGAYVGHVAVNGGGENRYSQGHQLEEGYLILIDKPESAS
jgi:hypothetical protein